MLLKNEIQLNHTQVGIWQIDEAPDYFISQMNITDSSRLKIDKMNERRKSEWLAARYLLQQMLGSQVYCYSDEFGKPLLQDSNRHLSISHSKGLAAVVVSDNPIGVDIQEITPKIQRVAHKFMRTAELKTLSETHSTEHLHIYWGAKEALYKAHGKKGLDFRQHILVEPFYYLPKGNTTGKVVKSSYDKTFDIQFDTFNEHCLVIAEAQ